MIRDPYDRMLPCQSRDAALVADFGPELQRCSLESYLWFVGMGMSLLDELSFAQVAQSMRHFLSPQDLAGRELSELFSIAPSTLTGGE